MAVVWYVSKYVAPPANSTVGSRGFFLMKEMGALGHQIQIVTSDSNHLATPPKLSSRILDQKIEGVSVRWIKTRKYRRSSSFQRILSWLDFEWRLLAFGSNGLSRPDTVIISSLSLLTVISGLYLKLRFRCLLVFEVRDIWPLTLVEEGHYSRFNPIVWVLAGIEWLGYRFSDQIVGTMPNLEEHVLNVLGFSKNVHCIPIGVVDRESHRNAPDFSVISICPAISSGRFIVGYVGSIGISNALDTLFEAAWMLQNNDRIHFLVVGDGDQRADFVRKFSGLPNVTIAEPVPKHAVAEILKRCDVLYFATHRSRVWDYGQSLNKLVEYMQAGKPILGSYSGYPSMVNESCCGFFIPAADVKQLISRLIELSSLADETLAAMGQNGAEWVALHRNYNTLARSYCDVIGRPD